MSWLQGKKGAQFGVRLDDEQASREIAGLMKVR